MNAFNITTPDLLSILPDQFELQIKPTLKDVSYTEYEPVLVQVKDFVLDGKTVVYPTVQKIADTFDMRHSKDEPYYEKVFYEFKHLIHMYEQGWITSRRQLVLTSQDCLSTIHMNFTDCSVTLNVFQRSSNIHNALTEDIAFLCFLLEYARKKFMKKSPDECALSLSMLISAPHSFGNNKSKVEQ